MPNTDRPAVQLVGGGGTYQFRIMRLSGGATSVQVRAIVAAQPAVVSVNSLTGRNAGRYRFLETEVGKMDLASSVTVHDLVCQEEGLTKIADLLKAIAMFRSHRTGHPR